MTILLKASLNSVRICGEGSAVSTGVRRFRGILYSQASSWTLHLWNENDWFDPVWLLNWHLLRTESYVLLLKCKSSVSSTCTLKWKPYFHIATASQQDRWLCQHADSNKQKCYIVITALLPQCWNVALLKSLWPWKVWVRGESVASFDAVAGARRRRRGTGGRREFSWRRIQCRLLVHRDLLLQRMLVCMSLFKNDRCKAVLVHNGQAVHGVFGFLNGALQFVTGTLRRHIKKV